MFNKLLCLFSGAFFIVSLCISQASFAQSLPHAGPPSCLVSPPYLLHSEAWLEQQANALLYSKQIDERGYSISYSSDSESFPASALDEQFKQGFAFYVDGLRVDLLRTHNGSYFLQSPIHKRRQLMPSMQQASYQNDIDSLWVVDIIIERDDNDSSSQELLRLSFRADQQRHAFQPKYPWELDRIQIKVGSLWVIDLLRNHSSGSWYENVSTDQQRKSRPAKVLLSDTKRLLVEGGELSLQLWRRYSQRPALFAMAKRRGPALICLKEYGDALLRQLGFDDAAFVIDRLSFHADPVDTESEYRSLASYIISIVEVLANQVAGRDITSMPKLRLGIARQASASIALGSLEWDAQAVAYWFRPDWSILSLSPNEYQPLSFDQIERFKSYIDSLK